MREGRCAPGAALTGALAWGDGVGVHLPQASTTTCAWHRDHAFSACNTSSRSSRQAAARGVGSARRRHRAMAASSTRRARMAAASASKVRRLPDGEPDDAQQVATRRQRRLPRHPATTASASTYGPARLHEALSGYVPTLYPGDVRAVPVVTMQVIRHQLRRDGEMVGRLGLRGGRNGQLCKPLEPPLERRRPGRGTGDRRVRTGAAAALSDAHVAVEGDASRSQAAGPSRPRLMHTVRRPRPSEDDLPTLVARHDVGLCAIASRRPLLG